MTKHFCDGCEAELTKDNKPIQPGLLGDLFGTAGLAIAIINGKSHKILVSLPSICKVAWIAWRS